jgi:hypothetical protein
MFYPLNHLLLLNLVIFKLTCNNLIFNEIMVLNALYGCLLHSHFVENHPIWILEDGPNIAEVVLSQGGSSADLIKMAMGHDTPNLCFCV